MKIDERDEALAKKDKLIKELFCTANELIIALIEYGNDRKNESHWNSVGRHHGKLSSVLNKTLLFQLRGK